MDMHSKDTDFCVHGLFCVEGWTVVVSVTQHTHNCWMLFARRLIASS